MNISMPRKGDAEKQTDLIPAGDTFEAEEARVVNLLHPKVGPPRIRRIEEQNQDMPRILPRDVSNLGQLTPPAGARPDPAGSSTVQVLERIPELAEPAPGGETATVEAEAMDLPPRRVRAGSTKAG